MNTTSEQQARRTITTRFEVVGATLTQSDYRTLQLQNYDWQKDAFPGWPDHVGEISDDVYEAAAARHEGFRIIGGIPNIGTTEPIMPGDVIEISIRVVD